MKFPVANVAAAIHEAIKNKVRKSEKKESKNVRQRIYKPLKGFAVDSILRTLYKVSYLFITNDSTF